MRAIVLPLQPLLSSRPDKQNLATRPLAARRSALGANDRPSERAKAASNKWLSASLSPANQRQFFPSKLGELLEPLALKCKASERASERARNFSSPLVCQDTLTLRVGRAKDDLLANSLYFCPSIRPLINRNEKSRASLR